MNVNPNWPDLLKAPAGGDHIVQVYQDKEFLAEAVGQYIGTGLRNDEAAIVIARPEHARAFEMELIRSGVDVDEAKRLEQLAILDAEETLALFLRDRMPERTAFHRAIGGLIAQNRLKFRAVRAYGEMVDVLWQRGERDAAIRLEEFWNELAKVHTFSLFCAYFMDNLDARSYGGPLECVCKVHTHMIPGRNYARFDQAVVEASSEVLGRPLAEMMLRLAANRPAGTRMPFGQSALLWLRKNMPLTADKILAKLSARA